MRKLSNGTPKPQNRAVNFSRFSYNVIANLRRRRGNPAFPLAAFLDCFSALAMTNDLILNIFKNFQVKETPVSGNLIGC
jgi:hypothetical protein